MNTIIDNEYATLLVYPEKRIVHHQFHKFIFGEKFREVMTRGADAFEKNRCTKWLSDDRGNSALRQEDVSWGQSTWEPRVVKAGWKHWALVLPEKILGQMNMKRIVEHYNQIGINTQIFSDPDEAMKWLEQQ